MSIRIIPRLDIKGPNVVKGVHLEGLRVMGVPELFAAQYYQDGADELIYIDVVASLYGRNSLDEVVRRAAQNIFIPLTVGGGIRTIDDIRRLLRAGADKVAINTAAIKNPKLIQEAARAFGSQCIVLYIEAKKRGPGRYECLTDNGRESTGCDVFEWVRQAVHLGAGEILLTSIDQEGTGKGYDLELTAEVAQRVDVPVIASGGAGAPEHIRDAVLLGKADAVCAASVFHYQLIQTGEASLNPIRFEEGNVEFLKGRLPIAAFTRQRIAPLRIPEIKEYLEKAGIPIRRLNLESMSNSRKME
ncbi:MAG: imidazole glycerol phosphate synthase subunit HisF [Candidatus Omnitrophica bacterium]|nr:imidazole glycerol phosphate synthase subunit HisF [Candidatus Omnitrophota bacterium]